MSLPPVPSRPERSQASAQGTTEPPLVPSRPGNRAMDRQQSPHRDHYPRSPFNELPPGVGGPPPSNGLRSRTSHDEIGEGPRRPPSVSLPSVGQEGNEYADLETHIVPAGATDSSTLVEGQTEPRERRIVANDLPLHAPKPSLSKHDAKQRVANVTGTGSGRGTSHTTSDTDYKALKSKASFRAASVDPVERSASIAHEEEHGIPEIGLRVPMYPDAGDVQAPSPAPNESFLPPGIGFHNSGATRTARHKRTPSGREVNPPGSYGLHGHGLVPADQFEQQWYAKHPDALEREEGGGEYGPGLSVSRPEWALSSEDLNKLVHDTAKAARLKAATPSEQIGYQASEQYVNRLQAPQQAGYTTLHANSSLPHVLSPLRKSSFPVDSEAATEQQTLKNRVGSRKGTEHVLESETEDEDVHIPPQAVRTSKYTGNGYDPPLHDLGPDGGNTVHRGGFIEETGYGAPILASDEVARTPGAEFQHPAVSPPRSRRGSAYVTSIETDPNNAYKSQTQTSSAANSRPGSAHGTGLGLQRFITIDDERESMHTPLENVEEYEPLFPEDDEGNRSENVQSAAERFKLREKMRRFPSQDIWEDTPSSLQLQTEVDTSEPTQAALPSGVIFETPEQEAARKGAITEGERAELLPRGERLAKSAFKPHIVDEMNRPSLKQRFPSRDIWEDSPDSAELTTIVGDVGNDTTSDPASEAGAIVRTTGRTLETKESCSSSGTQDAVRESAPPVPARPGKTVPQQTAVSPKPTLLETDDVKVDARQGPAIPERPKPEIPARPSKSRLTNSVEVDTSDALSSTSETLQKSASKPQLPASSKPVVPQRPTGGKIAALQGSFLADLNSRLKLGPQVPLTNKTIHGGEPEPEKESAVLSDARKGRAKGPARKKQAGASPSPALKATEVSDTALESHEGETDAVEHDIAPTEPATSQVQAAEPVSSTTLESMGVDDSLSGKTEEPAQTPDVAKIIAPEPEQDAFEAISQSATTKVALAPAPEGTHKARETHTITVEDDQIADD